MARILIKADVPVKVTQDGQVTEMPSGGAFRAFPAGSVLTVELLKAADPAPTPEPAATPTAPIAADPEDLSKDG